MPSSAQAHRNPASEQIDGPIDVSIVPHTHWDREWYEPFATFRNRLVGLLDHLLDTLEQDPSYAHFLLDGQTAVLDDYLEIRPEAADRIAALVEAERLAIGPWMILMDEFMVSGETMIRNLQAGLHAASRFGGAAEIGYLPDMFGHVDQMPQLLRLAGFDHAVVWRGVPHAVDRTGFWWQAPDGSRVRAEYLFGSYSNAMDLPTSGERLVEMAHDYEVELGPARLAGMLLMNGSDHRLPQPWLGRVVQEANATHGRYRFHVRSLLDHVRSEPTEGLPTWMGELRSGARANLLMGVASNRVDVHRAAAAAERSLERRAEPLAALFMPPASYPHSLLATGWRELILNSAHDSSCACSHDDVVDAVLTRYAHARHVGDAIAHDAMVALACSVDAPAGSTVLANPTAADRADLVELTVPGRGPAHLVGPDGTAYPAQLVATGRAPDLRTVAAGGKVRWVVNVIRTSEEAGLGASRVEVGGTEQHRTVRLVTAAPGEAHMDTTELRAQMREWGDAGALVSVVADGAPNRTLVLRTPVVPGFGWTTARLVDGPGPEGPVHGSGLRIGNEHLDVVVDTATGTYRLELADGTRWDGLGRLVESGDGGDTYNYCPPDHDETIERPESVRVECTESGPVRARLTITADYSWPTHAEGDKLRCSRRAASRAITTVTTTLEVRAGEAFVRVHHAFDHHTRDHRLRAHFPLPAQVTGSDAESAFSVVHRSLEAEGGATEAALATFPARRFVSASDGRLGLALVHDGLLEYEITHDGRELALTLLRATGYLSRLDLALRPDPAGPALALRGSQMPGAYECSYAVVPHSGDWRTAGLFEVADVLQSPIEHRQGGGVGHERPASGRGLEVRGATVSALLRDESGALVARVVRTDPEPGTVTVHRDGAPARGVVIDLRGQAEALFEGEATLRPWQILTIRLDDGSSPQMKLSGSKRSP